VNKVKFIRWWIFLVALVGIAIPAIADEPIVILGGSGAIIHCPYLPAQLTTIPLCNDKQATCVGTDGHDIIWGTDGPDVIYAGAGNDVVQADAGDDTVCGGPGNDSIHGARGNDVIFGDEGTDWLFGASGNDSLWGGDGDFDVLWGGPNDDFLDGGPGTKDVCLGQRDINVSNPETCEAIHPPKGYTHGSAEELGPGIIGDR
jgi:Ca2+-binding RTX toxin-like protein